MGRTGTQQTGVNREATRLCLAFLGLRRPSPIGPDPAIPSLPVPTEPAPPREAARAAPDLARSPLRPGRGPGPRPTAGGAVSVGSQPAGPGRRTDTDREIRTNRIIGRIRGKKLWIDLRSSNSAL
jgi:hypothetical protein